MTRDTASKFLRDILNQNGLESWHIRLTTDITKPFLGLCSYKDKTIILNAHHIDTHPDLEILNTIRHEVAHALTPNHSHDDIWATKAKELGCDNTLACANYSLSPAAIDAIRSGATLEVSFEEETHVTRRPKFTITQLHEKCPTCGKVAREKSSFIKVDQSGNDVKVIKLECEHFIFKFIPRATPFENFITFDHKDNKCKHTWDKNHCTSCDAYRLYSFQCDGARRIEETLAVSKGVGLFDDMGLGKTVQPLAYFNYHPEKFPVLFVVKSGVKYQFYKEILRWLGPGHIPQVISSGRDVILPGLKCYIIGYDLLRRFNREELKRANIKTVVLDECQQIKNPDSTKTQEVRRIVASVESVIPCSGTPWKNRGSEFFTVLNMLDSRRFDSYARFQQQWVHYYFEGNKTKEGGIRNPEKFKELVKDIIIRRERTEVMSELPLINRIKHFAEIDDNSQKIYDEEVSEFIKWYNDAVIGGEEEDLSTNNILAKLARMRHIVGLAKIPVTVAEVEEFIENGGNKIVIFIHHKDVGELLYRELVAKIPDITILRLTSDKSAEERFSIQEQFNKLDRVIMIGSTLASGEGLNLQTCDYCIMHERQWNPANEEQAEGRFIRIGQKSNSVTGKYITAAGTVDEHLDGIVESKRIQFHNAMNKGELVSWNPSSIINELAKAIVAGGMAKVSRVKKMASLVKR